jgi:hypothetical protein
MPDKEQRETEAGSGEDIPRVQLRITEAFIEDIARIYSARVEQRIRNALLMIENNPDIGSPLARKSLAALYGSGIRTYALSSFVLIYRHDKGYVDILGLVYGPSIR